MGFAAVMTAVSAVASLASSVAQGQAQAQSQKNQAKMAEYNAQVAEMNASISRSEGQIEAAEAAEKAYKARGNQAASLAQAGILSSATGDILQDELKNQAEDEQFKIQFGNTLQTQGLLNEAHNYRQQAKISNSNAKQSIIGGWLNGAGSVAGSLANGYGNWSKLSSGS